MGCRDGTGDGSVDEGRARSAAYSSCAGIGIVRGKEEGGGVSGASGGEDMSRVSSYERGVVESKHWRWHKYRVIRSGSVSSGEGDGIGNKLSGK